MSAGSTGNPKEYTVADKCKAAPGCLLLIPLNICCAAALVCNIFSCQPGTPEINMPGWGDVESGAPCCELASSACTVFCGSSDEPEASGNAKGAAYAPL